MLQSVPTRGYSRLLDQQTAISITQYANERRELQMDVGALGIVTVLESPTAALTDEEWRHIMDARGSYGHMWGGRPNLTGIEEDPFDSRGECARLYNTIHYIASIRTPGKKDKFLTMRKVAVNRAAIKPGMLDTMPALVDDVSFWKVRDTTKGIERPLSEVLKRYVERKYHKEPYASPTDLPIAGLSRVGTLPYEIDPNRDRNDRNRSAVVFALIQVAASEGDSTNVLYMAQPCEEFRSTVFALRRPDNSRVELAYRRTAQTIGLPVDNWDIVLDRNNPTVRKLMCNFPGFWLDNATFAKIMHMMLGDGALRAADFHGPGQELLNSPDALLLKDEQISLLRRIIARRALSSYEMELLAFMFANARFAKYLTSLIERHDELRRRIYTEVGDGPYSSTLVPRELLRSALYLLSAAKEMYACKGFDS
jgi:hypothetical protein